MDCDAGHRLQLTCSRGMPESAHVRRLTALLVLWVGLLGAISPAFACAVSPSGGDCCPPDASPECRQAWAFERLESASAAMYCLAPAMPSQAVTIGVARDPLESQHDGPLPEPCAIVAWAEFYPDRSPQREFIAPLKVDARTDATLTYLKTGRLRL
jgi:hypothetical protein